MKKRLFIYTTLIIFAGLLCFFALSVSIIYTGNLNIAKDTVMEAARICANLYDDNIDASTFVKVGGDTRITVISAEGQVLADSRPLDLGSIENHLDRPEIQAAAEGAPAPYIRHSDTLGADYIYYALKAGGGDNYVFIRAAIPVAKIDAYFFQSLPLLIVLLLAVALLCFVFSRGMIRRITKPFEAVESRLRLLSSGGYQPGPGAGNDEEVNAIIRGIDEVAQVVQQGFFNLRNEKTKLDYILGNIGDGLFVVDDNQDVALINSAALGIFSVTPEISGKNLNYLTNEKPLIDMVRDCINHGEDALSELRLNGCIYFTTVKRIPDIGLTMAVLSDVTENRENAKRREEFFANASHELKTPLTAIKGFNELTAINTRDENISKYIEGITRETDRMLSLIGDMLRLSELENTQELHPVPVSLAAVALEARDALAAPISANCISVEVSGDATVEAEPGHIYDLLKNLMENAVRYNNRDGRVSVTIKGDKGNARLSVTDNGVGISPEEQARIFERFYRVEKSRSQGSGGTGLGLSIVKHISALYGWKLSVKSRPGVGTEITVVFPSPRSSGFNNNVSITMPIT